MKPRDVERAHLPSSFELGLASHRNSDTKEAALLSKELPRPESWDGVNREDHIVIRPPPRIATFDRTTEPGRD
jgi:hypothetical protein